MNKIKNFRIVAIVTFMENGKYREYADVGDVDTTDGISAINIYLNYLHKKQWQLMKISTITITDKETV